MPSEEDDWRPSKEDLALWRFLRLTGRNAVAVRCLTDGRIEMGAFPPEQLFATAFVARHGDHELRLVTDELDAFLEEA